MSPSGYEDQIVADYYDFAEPLKQRDDVQFFVNQAKQAGGNVLELGCGSGRVLVPAAEAGLSVTGIDTSNPMLNRCRQKVDSLSPEIQSRIQLHLGSMSCFDLEEQFSLITIPFRGFHHLILVEDQLSCLQCVVNHLKPDGLFILDLFNPVLQRILDEKGAHAVHEEPEITLPDGRRVKRIQKNVSPNPNTQILQAEHTYHIEETDGSQNTFTTTYPMRYFFRYEIEHLLARCGLEIQSVYSDFQESPFDEFKPGEMLFLSRKTA